MIDSCTPTTSSDRSGRAWRVRSTVALTFLLCGLPAALRAIQVPFAARQTIASADGASALVAADVDRDGDLDLLTASSEDDTVAWHENDGSQSFTPHVIATADSAVSVFATDLDRDGDIDVLAAADLDDTVAWHENDGSQSFTRHVIAAAADGARSVSAADIDGDGDIDVLAALATADTITWFENDGSQSFTPHTVTTSADLVVSVTATDLDRDGDVDLLAASAFDDTIAWFENDGSQAFTAHAITSTADGAASVAASDIDRDGDLDLLTTAAFANTVTWWENDGVQGFTAHDITTTADGAQSAIAHDVDLDGDLDVVAASADDGIVAWWENDGAQSFTARVLTTTAGSPVMAAVADLDDDGDTDVLAASFGDDTFGWFENLAIHRSAVFPDVVTLPGVDVRSFLTADVDGDADLDVVFHRQNDVSSAALWSENLDGTGTGWSEHVILDTGIGRLTSLRFSSADVDGDGDLDLFVASFDDFRVDWYENTAGDGSAWTRSTVAPAIDPFLAEARDVDRDGDVDAIMAEGSAEVTWQDNVAGDGSSWSETLIAGPENFGAASADLDRDGDVDVVATAGPSSSDTDLLFYENTAGDGSAWTPQPMAADRSGFAPGDIDGDGDLDGVTRHTVAGGEDRLLWLDNAAGNASSWSENVIRVAESPQDRSVADLDSDGDADVLSRYSSATVQAIWFENLTPGDGTLWGERPILDPAVPHSGLQSADIDGDGDLDLVSLRDLPRRIAWYPNRGGQFALPTTVTAPATIPPGTTEDLFAIEAFHRGRPGDLDLELATFELVFEEGAGDPLTSTEANALIERLEVYLDDGSGLFDPADTPVVTIDTLALTDGLQLLTLPDGAADVRLAAGASRLYFVTVEMTADAAQQTPPHFRATHRTEGGSSAEDVPFDLPLVIEFAADATTGTIEARPAEIFADGFESGDTSAWTGSVP